MNWKTFDVTEISQCHRVTHLFNFLIVLFCIFELLGAIMHGPLKLRTVHLSDNTMIYESKVSVQNVFP
jgi:hypothetical protein